MVQSRPPANTPRAHPLRREIAWALMFKMIALGVIYLAFFGPAHRPRVTPSGIAAIFGQSAQIQGNYRHALH
jgi:hypothetical protein